MSEYAKPLPRGDGLNGEFYEYCRRHELRFQRCSKCGRWRHMPRETCPDCGSREFDWARSSGRGEVYTWTVVYRASHPGFEPEVPFAAVVVEMEEGPRVVSHLVDVPIESLAIGMPVEVVFDDVTPEWSLPKFRRAVAA